jgi:hypothetical protein
VKIPSSRSSPCIVLPTFAAFGPEEEFFYSLLSSTACCFGLYGSIEALLPIDINRYQHHLGLIKQAFDELKQHPWLAIKIPPAHQ